MSLAALEIWFADEARIGQKNNVWPAPSASGFSRAPDDQSAVNVSGFGDVLPAKMEIRAFRSS